MEFDTLARIFHELLSRDHEDGSASSQPQGVGPEAYLIDTSQGEPVLPVPGIVPGSLPKEHPRSPGKTVISAIRLRRIREISGLEMPGINLAF